MTPRPPRTDAPGDPGDLAGAAAALEGAALALRRASRRVGAAASPGATAEALLAALRALDQATGRLAAVRPLATAAAVELQARLAGRDEETLRRLRERLARAGSIEGELAAALDALAAWPAGAAPGDGLDPAALGALADELGGAAGAAAQELLAGRGLRRFPADPAAATDELARRPERYEVRPVDAEAPRGAVVRLVRRGLHDAVDGRVVARAVVETSRGPRPALLAALEAVEAAAAAAGPTPGAPLEGLAAARAAVERGEPPALAPLAAALAACGALGGEAAAAAGRAVAALAPLGVLPAPAPGDGGPRAWPGPVEARDDARPPGAPLEVRRPGLVRRAGPGAQEDELLVAPDVVVSRGPRPALLLLLDRLARGEPLPGLAPVAADLAARVDRARDAEARGGGADDLRRARVDALVIAGLDLLRAAQRLELRSADAVAAVMADALEALDEVDPDIETVPRPGADEVDPGLADVEEAFDETVPRGRVVRVKRPGLVDRRGGARRVHQKGLVVVSRGPRPPLEDALDRLVALWPGLAQRANGKPPASPEDVAERVQALRLAARRLDDAAALGKEPDAGPLADAAAGLLDLVEERVLLRDDGARALGELLDGPLKAGLLRHGVELGADDTAVLARRRSFSEKPAGELLGPARRGVRAGTRVVRKGELLVSLGPRPALLRLPDALEPTLALLPDDVRGPLQARVSFERALEAQLLAGKPLAGGAPRDRALTLLDALDKARAAAGVPAEARDALLRAVHGGPLGDALQAEGLRPFPAPGEVVAEELLGRDGAFDQIDGRPGDGPRGRVLDVAAVGLLEGPAGGETVKRAARATLDLGLDPRFVDALDGAAAADGTGAVGPLVARLRDPRQVVPEAQALDALFASWCAAQGEARGALARGLRALDAEPFPAEGQAWSGHEGDVRRVWSDAPAGQVLKVLTPGLRKGDRVLRRPSVEVSRGQPTPAQRALGDAADALRRVAAAQAAQAAMTGSRPPALPGGAAPPPPPDAESPALRIAAALDGASERLEALAPGDADRLLVDLLGDVEGCDAEAAAALARLLADRGLRALPVAPGGDWERLQAEAGPDAFDPPRRGLGPEAPGKVLSIERRAVLGPSGVLRKGLVRVSAGPPTELSQLGEALRPGLQAALQGSDLAAAQAELDEVQERIVSAHAERGYLLALPLLNLLQKHDLKDKLGKPVKDFLLKHGVKEITAYAGYDANKLGPSRLEEVRNTKSDRPKGKIVKIIRPGFERESEVLQRVRAEVSR